MMEILRCCRKYCSCINCGVSDVNMGRQIITFILAVWSLSSFGQKTILFRPFIDDHKVFSYKVKSIGFMNIEKYNKTWQFTIDQFNNKVITVKQINDSLLSNCNDSIALAFLRSWYRISVDSISINHYDNFHELTIGLNNIYNEDNGASVILFLKVLLYYDKRTDKNNVNRIQYLSIIHN